MNRKTIFRGLDFKDNWHYGFFIDISALNDKNEGCRIYERLKNGGCYIPIKRKTIGEYIGLKDKNDKKIFEGDIISYERDRTSGYKSVVEFNNGRFQDSYWHDCICDLQNIEVIGNIYENSELLK